MLARANRPEDESPWAIIIDSVPVHPQKDWFIKPAVRRPMWLTDEYAISDFISGCRTQINLVIVAPQMAIEIMNGADVRLGGWENLIIRRRP